MTIQQHQTDNKRHITNQKNVRDIMIYATIFVATFSLFSVPNVVMATHDGCGAHAQYNTEGLQTESGDRNGAEGILKIKNITPCGTTTNQSYGHHTVAMTMPSSDFIEAGIYKGYAQGFATGNNMHYVLIYDNEGGYSFRDLTSESSGTKKPNVNDQVKITVFWDYYAWWLGKDFYKVIINNITQNHQITVSDIWSHGTGVDPLTQVEILNQNTVVKSEAATLKDRTTTTWDAWTSSAGFDRPSSGNPLCFIKDANDKYRFGVDSGSTCSTS